MTTTTTMSLKVVIVFCCLVASFALQEEEEEGIKENDAVKEITEENDDEGEYTISRVIRQIRFPGGQPNGGGGQGQNPGRGGCACGPLVACASVATRSVQSCTQPDGNPGVCCNIGSGLSSRRLFSKPVRNVQMNPISTNVINQFCQKGKQALQDQKILEQNLVRQGKVVPKSTPARNHFSVFRIRRATKDAHEKADEVAEASSFMKQGRQLTNDQAIHGLRNFQVSQSILQGNCPRNPRCNFQSKYRTLDGTCNNQRRPLLGASSTPMQRILPPKYDDGVWAPRQRSVQGGPLPNPRVVANTVLIDRDTPNPEFTLSVMQWAQFIDHDVAHTPFKEMGEAGEPLECCVNNQVPNARVHRYCDPIPILNDAFFTPKRVFCMNFVRSMLALDDTCQFGHAEQVNALTHWLDASNIYGNDDHEARTLRSGRGGQLQVSNNNLLPFSRTSECEGKLSKGVQCFNAGDSRVNEQPGLTAIHIVWHREHNRIAQQLQQLHPGWSDEALYQEARRIVTAEYQHIVYNEWLPNIIGHRFMSSFDLSPKQFGQAFDYNPNINPNLNNEFATGAFRFGHTLVQGILRLVSANGAQSTISLRDHFNSPHLIQQNRAALDNILRSLMDQNIQSFDSFITNELTNHLFQTPRVDFGMDLMSLNINRGRDHGIATYNDLRDICGLGRARNFEDLTKQIPLDAVQRMANVYKHVDDVDLFVGGISEAPLGDAILGPVFTCIVGDQFARFKKADRYFYDIGGQPGAFTEGQLSQIRRASWARILCDNSETINSVQPLAMKLKDGGRNRPVSCQDRVTIPSLDVRAWAGERPSA